MATVTIDLSDQHAAALKAKAEAEGLTLEDWFKKLALQEAEKTPSVPRKRRYSLAELIAQSEPPGAVSDIDHEWLDAPPVGREAL